MQLNETIFSEVLCEKCWSLLSLSQSATDETKDKLNAHSTKTNGHVKLTETTENGEAHDGTKGVTRSKSTEDENIVKIQQTTKSKRDTSADRKLKVILLYPQKHA